MKIEIDDKSGFCFGVVKAITTAENLLSETSEGPVFSLGDIVHNHMEVHRLEKLGLRTISHDRLEEMSGRRVLIRAHGEPPQTYETADRFGLELTDATCPVVANLQRTVRTAQERMDQLGGQVVILGKPGHAEVVGLTGQTEGKALVVEHEDDLQKVDFGRPIYFLSQTTQSLSLFEKIGSLIREKARNPASVTVHDTICRQVSNRHPHLKQFAARFDVVIFVSGSKSSNGKALFEACRETNSRSYKVENGLQIDPAWFENADSVGICGATSTPKWLMEEIAEAIARLS